MSDEIAVIVKAADDHQILVRINDDGTVSADERFHDGAVWRPVGIQGGSVEVMIPNGMGSRLTSRIDRDFHVIVGEVTAAGDLAVCPVCYVVHDPTMGCPREDD